MTQQDIITVKIELKRFETRLESLQARIDKKDNYDTHLNGCKESGAVKRAAMDLKNELTKLTK